MNLFLFVVLLVVATFGMLLLFPIGVFVVLSPLAVLQKIIKVDKFPAFISSAILGLAGVYYLGLWAAVTAGLAHKFTEKPEVKADWLYWIIALVASVISIYSIGKSSSFNDSEREKLLVSARKMSRFGSFFILILFCLFGFQPSYIDAPYGWILGIFGL